MNGILVYVGLEETALGLLTKARSLAVKLNKPLSVALLGNDISSRTDPYLSSGVDHIYLGDDQALTHFQASTYAEALAQIVTLAGADIVLTCSTLRGRELAPRLAQKLSAGCLTDAIGISIEGDRLIVERRALGGNTIAAKAITSPQQVIAVMPNLYDAEPVDGDHAEVIPVSLQLTPRSVKLVERRPKTVGVVNIEEAEVLVCVGRGVREEEDLDLLHQLADAIGGLVCCTRPISHENHWLAEDQMVGISGKVLSPRLYLGIGVSGQIQHTVGIMNSKHIVAINSDANAPIFKIADYGIIGDLYQIVPNLIERIQQDDG